MTHLAKTVPESRELSIGRSYGKLAFQCIWIAEIEKDLRSRGVWEAFLSSVSAQTGSDWTRLRETARARSALVHGLMDVLPEVTRISRSHKLVSMT